MKITLLFLVLFSHTLFGQQILLDTKDEPYSDRVISDSVKQLIPKAEKYWQIYGQKGFERVDIEFNNSRSLTLTFDTLGNGIKFIEFYEDTVGIELYYSKQDSSFSLKTYEWFYGYTQFMDYWYPNDNIREQWYYSENEVLERTIKTTLTKESKVIDETIFEFYEGTTTRKIYKFKNQKWVLKKEFILEN
jgi:hypothetical protein